MDLAEEIWSADWTSKTLKRVREKGAENLLDFLSSRPAVPYLMLAKELGPDIAAIQLVRLQFAETGERYSIRSAVMDAAARLCHEHLKRGWGKGVHVDFNTAGVYADIVSYLKMRENADAFVAKWNVVWQAIKDMHPPEGWLPSGPADSVLVAAFEKGWPLVPRRKIKRQQYGFLCPNCTALLSFPSADDSEIVCHHCGEHLELD